MLSDFCSCPLISIDFQYHLHVLEERREIARRLGVLGRGLRSADEFAEAEMMGGIRMDRPQTDGNMEYQEGLL